MSENLEFEKLIERAQSNPDEGLEVVADSLLEMNDPRAEMIRLERKIEGIEGDDDLSLLRDALQKKLQLAISQFESRFHENFHQDRFSVKSWKRGFINTIQVAHGSPDSVRQVLESLEGSLITRLIYSPRSTQELHELLEIPAMQRIRHLHITAYDGDGVGLLAASSSLPSLTSLSIWGHKYKLSDSDAEMLAQMEKLRVLEIRFANLTGHGALALIQGLPNLVVLDLMNNKLRSPGAHLLAQDADKNNLDFLNLEGNHVYPTAKRELWRSPYFQDTIVNF